MKQLFQNFLKPSWFSNLLLPGCRPLTIQLQ